MVKWVGVIDERGASSNNEESKIVKIIAALVGEGRSSKFDTHGHHFQMCQQGNEMCETLVLKSIHFLHP
jgi:hypothetical protein